MISLAQALLSGVLVGGVYGLLSIGFSLAFGVMRIVNFAHGDVFMLGGLFSWAVLQDLFGGPISNNYGVLTGGMLIAAFVVAFMVAMASCGVVGFVIERFAYRPLRGAPKLAPMVTAIGVSFIIENATLVWQIGTNNGSITYPSLINPEFIHVLGLNVSNKSIIVFIAAPVLMVALVYLVGSTRIGKAMRATAQDPEAARMMGIDINRVISFTFVVGSILAGAAGVIYGLYYNSIDYSVGFLAGLKAFTAAVLGGIGNIRGAMLGGLLVGEVEALVSAIDAGQGVGLQWAEPAVFAVLMCVLVFRPTGLLGAQVVDKA